MRMDDFGSEKLRKILNQIELDPEMRQLYDSRWHTIVNFLFNNTGIPIAKIAQVGSMAKGTGHRESDLDVGFCVPNHTNIRDAFKKVLQSAEAAFGHIANAYSSPKAIHIDYLSPPCKVDVVPLSETEFDLEFQQVKTIRQLPPWQREAVILVKYAIAKEGGKVRGFEVEKAVLALECPDLFRCVVSLITQMTKPHIELSESVAQQLGIYGYFEDDDDDYWPGYDEEDEGEKN